PHLDPESLVDLFHRERVTLTGGVPTIWMGVLQFLDANPRRYDLSAIRAMYVGGSAVPQALIEAFERRHGLPIIQAWGMTEMAPVGTVAHIPGTMAEATDERKFAYRAKQGRPAPLVEIRARNEDGLVPWDGQTMGDLRAFLAPQFPKFWLPDAFEFIDAIPRTSAGKFKKSELRERFRDYRLAD